MKSFREEIMDALNDFYEKYDGRSPDHLLVSQKQFEWMQSEKKFEKLAKKDGTESSEYGYMGMHIWGIDTLEADSEPIAVLIEDETFWEKMPQAKDFYGRR
jgi:hypothetical protein